MNWDPWFITQDSKARTMSPVFLSTVQDTSWDPWPHRVRKRNVPWFQWTVLYNVIGGKSSGKTLSLNNTCQSLRSHGVRGHRGHTYSGIINTAHSELVVNTLFQTGHLGIKPGKKLMKGVDERRRLFFFQPNFLYQYLSLSLSGSHQWLLQIHVWRKPAHSLWIWRSPDGFLRSLVIMLIE